MKIRESLTEVDIASAMSPIVRSKLNCMCGGPCVKVGELYAVADAMTEHMMLGDDPCDMGAHPEDVVPVNDAARDLYKAMGWPA